MSDKDEGRVRRGRATRAKIAQLKAVRLTVYRSNTHIYAQVIDSTGSKVLASASTAEAEVRAAVKKGGNVQAAAEIGKRIAEKAKQLGIAEVAFDRSGYKFHGRVKALAQAAREAGLKF
ncbi:MAG: ribosomal protein [Betaproteobacteria bacterium]|jgi:large subunit ribosomal protein L18|nr:ribosomal protein [Betaproteobacteria bacterium]MEA3157963.1 large subunit ribosomal protein [Betaproteobacteria bacterium]